MYQLTRKSRDLLYFLMIFKPTINFINLDFIKFITDREFWTTLKICVLHYGNTCCYLDHRSSAECCEENSNKYATLSIARFESDKIPARIPRNHVPTTVGGRGMLSLSINPSSTFDYSHLLCYSHAPLQHALIIIRLGPFLQVQCMHIKPPASWKINSS